MSCDHFCEKDDFKKELKTLMKKQMESGHRENDRNRLPVEEED